MRKTNWHHLLDTHIRASAQRDFAWGVHDCAMFACDAILAMTGDDPAMRFRGTYDSEEGAREALEGFVGGGLLGAAQVICTQMGYAEINPRFAQRGDVVLSHGGQGDSLGVVGLNGREALIAAKYGLLAIPLKTLGHAWRVE